LTIKSLVLNKKSVTGVWSDYRRNWNLK